MIVEDYRKNGVPKATNWIDEEKEVRKELKQNWFRSQNGKDSQKDNGDLPRQDVESDDQRVVHPSQSDSEHAKAPHPIWHESGDAGRSGDDVTADEPW